MNVTSVKRIHQSDWTDSGVRFLRARDIVAASKNEELDDYLYISEEKYEEYSTLSGKVDIDDLLVTGVGTIGVPYLVENLEPLYFKDGNIIWFQNQNKIDGKFLYYSFIGNGIQSFIKAFAGTGTVGTYTIDTGKKTPIQIPSKEEQKKIGKYFSTLDHLISLHQRKCEETKKLKKYMLQKMFPQNGQKIPEIRFSGFTEDWEQRKFSEIALRESTTQEASRDFPSVEYEDVITEAGRLNKDVYQKEAVKKGIVFDGSQVLYGKLRPYLHNWLNPEFSGVAVGDWWVLKPIETDKSFLYRLIQTQQFDDIANQSTGSKMPRADWKLVSDSEFAVPISQNEQAKIGEYFGQLDTLITLHHRKRVKIQKDVINDWEQRKLNDISDVRDGTHDSPTYQNTGHPFVTSKNVKDGFINYDDIQFISDEDFNEINKRSKVDVNDILMGMIGTIGNMALIRTEPDFAIKNVALIKDTKQINYLYLYHFLHSPFIEKQLSSGMDGGTQKFVSLGNVRNLDIVYPSEVEQIKLGDCFEHLDNLISLHQHKQKYLKKH